MLSNFEQENLLERDLYEGLGVDGRKILQWIIKRLVRVSIREIGLIRLRIGIIGEPL